MNYFAVFLGLLVVIIEGAVTSSFFIFGAPRISNMGLLQSLVVFFSIFTLISPLLGAAVVGWRVRERGWMYGAILGVILLILSMGIVSLTFILPESLVSGPNLTMSEARTLSKENLHTQAIHAPALLAMTALGGFLGSWLRRRKSSTESPSTPLSTHV